MSSSEAICLNPGTCRAKRAARCPGCLLAHYNRSPEGRAEKSETLRRRHADPLYAACHRARMAEASAKPEVRAKRVAQCKANSSDPFVLAKISAGVTAAWVDPGKRAAMLDGQAGVQRRAAAKRAVRAAGLPLYRSHVERAARLRAQGLKGQKLIAELVAELGEAPRG